MEQVYDVPREHTRNAVARVYLESVSWNDIHEKSFEVLQHALEHQVTLAHVDLAKCLCVFMDASDLLWAVVISQTSYEDLSLTTQD